MRARLPRSAVLRQKRDFERVLFRGRRLKDGAVGIYYAPRRSARRRVAFITAGKFRTNVARNRVKRCLREIYRTHQAEFPAEFDFILRGEFEAVNLEFDVMRDLLLGLARKVKPT